MDDASRATGPSMVKTRLVFFVSSRRPWGRGGNVPGDVHREHETEDPTLDLSEI